MKKHFFLLVLSTFCTFLYSQTTYDCEFQYGNRYDLNSIKVVEFEYTIGVSGEKKIKDTSRNYLYTFEAKYENGSLESSLTVYDIDNVDEDDYLYFASSDVMGKPNYFYIDLITTKIAIDCICERK